MALEGTMMLLLGEPPEKVEVPPGSVVVLPVGIPVQVVNEGDEDSLILIVGAPPSNEAGEFLADVPPPES